MANSKEQNIDNVRTKFEDVCRELNMDRETEEKSWKKFSEISQSFSLEGNPLHWFCCAIFAACRESFTPTVSGLDAVVMGNCISLNKLLRSCKMSFYQFFSNVKNWHEMANLSDDFLNQINRLERTFSITYHLFQRYDKIYDQLFSPPPNEKKNTKYRSATKCSSVKLYDFCWTLYLCAKNQNPNYTIDLVTSYHLLICCFDLIYMNVLSENRTDLINPKFNGVPDKWNTPNFNVSTVGTHCIIDPLCSLAGAIPVETITMREHSWKNIIKDFFRSKTIYGNEDTFLGLVSNQNFERNMKSLNSAYEQFVLSMGESDERIFLNNPNYRKINTIEESVESTIVEHHENIRSLIPHTPYTRKQYLPSKDVLSEPVTNATNNVKKLQDIADITEPPEFIRQNINILNKIQEKLSVMSSEFYANYPQKARAAILFKLAKSLYYYMLDKIVRVEIKTKPNIDLNVLFNAEMFTVALIACCVEIVLDAYDASDLKFPWILSCFKISAFDFSKIIEIVVRRHDGILTRALIKHLNYIEETCFESLAWKKSSPVWDRIKAIDSPLPSWSDVDVSNMSKRYDLQMYSPMNNSAFETFSSQSAGESARRDLFNTHKESEQSEKPIENTKKQIEINKRAGSLLIFLRKFYELSWLRIKALCTELDMVNNMFLNIIWTLFEYSITQRTELIKDRHLDQLIMCAIYLYIKVGEIPNKSFTDIMKFYRKQPQATSSTYREVLIESSDQNDNKPPKFGDLIYFYNNIYVGKMTSYALSFSERKKSQRDLLLSPHPTEKQTAPRKLSNNTSLFVYSMEKSEVTQSPNQLIYEFSKSPGKDLEKLNEIVRSGKRNLPFDDNSQIIETKLPREASFLKRTLRMMKDREEERRDKH